MRELAQSVLASIGSRMSSRSIHNLNAALSYMETGRWLRSKGLKPQHRVADRMALFDLILERVADEEVLYLEFGVWWGASIGYWSTHLKNPRAMLHGFDSFEGLPESWNINSPKGDFSTHGTIPDIADPKVKFYKGWFEQTLPNYVFPPHERLVVNMDADLYSSTQCVLSLLRPHLVVGSYIYFDEFADRFNELKAFAEFLEATHWKFELLGVNNTLSRVVFRRIE